MGVKGAASTPPSLHASCPSHQMARTFKFSFPLPSRRQNYDSQPTPFYDVTDLPLRSPGSKAERVLGTSDAGGKGVRNPPPPGRKEKKGPKHPGYMSVTVRETDELSLQAGSSATLKPLHRLTSSPLPQTQHMHQAPEWDTRSATDVAGDPRSQSSSTLQSYYDSSKSPLSISQQTSASSARDMALRKGYPSVISPSAPKAADVHGTLKMGKGDGAVKPKARPKHLNLQFNLSSFGYKPDGPVKPVLSPNHVVRSPSPISVASGHQQSGHRSRPKFFLWERKKSKESVSGGVEGPQERLCKDEKAPVATEAKWKPHPKVVGDRFDGGLADQNHPGGQPERPLSQNLEGSVTMPRADHARRHRLRRSKSSISELSDELEHHYPTGARSNSASLPYHPPLRSQQRLEEPRPASETSGRRDGHRTKENLAMAFSNINMHEHSFLTLSSSDEEIEDGENMTDALNRRRRIRASVATADTGEEVIFCSAQRATHVKPRPVIHLPRRKSPRAKESDSIPPVPSIPARLPLNPRISSIRWREESKNSLPGLDTRSNSDHSRQSSRTSYSASRVSPLGSHRTPPRIENKMMAVTPDEEKLLEAMRRKRASIREEALAEHMDDFNLARRDVKSSSRPKTAGIDGPCQTCYFESERSVSPSLASGPVAGRPTLSLTASADYPVHDEPSFLRSGASLCRCPARSSSPGGPGRISTAFSDSGMSIPHLSFNPSDILPSTPAMSDATGEDLHGAAPHAGCASPLTPPLDHGPLDLDATELVGADDLTSHSEPILVMGERGYDRKRTVGSHVVVLDSTYPGGRDARTLEEDNGVTSWGMDRW